VLKGDEDPDANFVTDADNVEEENSYEDNGESSFVEIKL